MRSNVGSVQDVRGSVVGRLRARRGELLEAIFLKVQAGALAVADEPDAEYLAGLRAAVAAAVEYSLEGIERGEEWAGLIPAAAVEQARRAARAGVSLDTVLRRYVVGNALLEQVVLEEADRGERGVLRAALRAQASVLDRLLAAVTVEYGDELARAGRTPGQRRGELVKRLLDGAGDEHARLDYELEGWHLGAIAIGTGAADAVRELAVNADRRLLSVEQGQRSVWAWFGGRERPAYGDLERLLVTAGAFAGVVLALGEPARGIEGWRVTHRQAQAALLVALRRHEPTGVVRYGEVALLAFALKDEALARSLVEIYLAPLDRQRDGGQGSRETLRAYLAAGRSASSSAAALGVTRNTVENRLRTVEGCLGRPLPTCLSEIEVALGLEQLDDSGGDASPPVEG
jgi:PucR C-terminal helix-turn-helix domain/GGDEF-like domain